MHSQHISIFKKKCWEKTKLDLMPLKVDLFVHKYTLKLVTEAYHSIFGTLLQHRYLPRIRSWPQFLPNLILCNLDLILNQWISEMCYFRSQSPYAASLFVALQLGIGIPQECVIDHYFLFNQKSMLYNIKHLFF